MMVHNRNCWWYSFLHGYAIFSTTIARKYWPIGSPGAVWPKCRHYHGHPNWWPRNLRKSPQCPRLPEARGTQRVPAAKGNNLLLEHTLRDLGHCCFATPNLELWSLRLSRCPCITRELSRAKGVKPRKIFKDVKNSTSRRAWKPQNKL